MINDCFHSLKFRGTWSYPKKYPFWNSCEWLCVVAMRSADKAFTFSIQLGLVGIKLSNVVYFLLSTIMTLLMCCWCVYQKEKEFEDLSTLISLAARVHHLLSCIVHAMIFFLICFEDVEVVQINWAMCYAIGLCSGSKHLGRYVVTSSQNIITYRAIYIYYRFNGGVWKPY